jgi:hypothetical protein
VYVETARMVESLAGKYGFTPIFVWQPTLHTTTKQLTPYEQRTMQSIDRSPFWRRQKEAHRLIPPMLDSAMADVAPGRFVDLVGLFKGDTMAVFTDRIGHNTEASIPRIVDGFWPTLDQAVRRQRGRSTALAAPPALPRPN